MSKTFLTAARQRSSRFWPALVLAACLGLSALAASAAGTSYSYQDLGIWTGGRPPVMNSNGQVAGVFFDTGATREFPALWKDGMLTELPTLGGSVNHVADLNDRGQAVGLSFLAGNNSHELHAVLWEQGRATDLNLQHSQPSVHINPIAINENGQILCQTNGNPANLLWENGTFTHLANVDDSVGVSVAVALNDNGQVAGYWDDGTGSGLSNAVIWNEGIPTRLSELVSQASAINNSGQVAGWTWTEESGGDAVVWQPDGTMVNLGLLLEPLLDPLLGPTHSTAVDINAQGQVIGWAHTQSGSQYHGFFWQDSDNNGTADAGELQILGTLGGSSLYTGDLDINSRGQVTGSSFLEGDTTRSVFIWENGVMTDLTPDRSVLDSVGINDLGQVLFYAFDSAESQTLVRYSLVTPVNTPAGSEVTVEPTSDVSVTFSSVTSPGNTTFTPIATPEPPVPDVSNALYFDISTTATFTGPVQISVRYDPSGFTSEENIGLWHFENGVWENIRTSIDTLNNVVYGETSSFSPFAVAQMPHYWSGVLQPVNADGSSVFKLGSTVPVKFQLTGDSAGITNLAARLFLTKLSNGIAGTEVEAESNSAADTGNVFRYSGGQYQFNLGTRMLSEGTWRMRIDLGDGALHTVDFSLRR